MENTWQCFGLASSLLLQDIKVQIRFGYLNHTLLLSKGACNFGDILYQVISATWLATVYFGYPDICHVFHFKYAG